MFCLRGQWRGALHCICSYFVLQLHYDSWRASSTQQLLCLDQAQKVVRGLWLGLTDKERWDVACKTVEHLKEHGDRWRLNEEERASPLDGAHSSPRNFTEALNQKTRP